MKSNAPRHARFCRLLPALLACLGVFLAACGGGGDQLAGVGSGGSGVASGSVSGFGSVIVDGVEYDDSSASRQTQGADGSSVNAQLKLGQRVRLVYSGSRVASSIEIQAQLLGPVSAAPSAAGLLRVMGQPVRVVESASDASLSTPTVLDGYAAAADINAGDDVEVHGVWTYDATLASQVLVASRIEKRAATVDPVQLGGVVVAISGQNLRLNGPVGTLVQADSLSGVAVGDVLRVWTARSALAVAPVRAARIAGSGVSSADLDSHSSVKLSGLASSYNPVTRTVVVDGLTVKLGDGVNVDEAALARGEFLSLELGKSGSTVVAKSATVRSGSADLGRTVEIKGVLRAVDWSAATVNFSLRDTAVQAAASVIAASCKVADSTSDLYVEVRGRLAASSPVVTAAEVKCSRSFSGPVSADYRGSLIAIDTTTRQLSLRLDGSSTVISASWDTRTYFEQRPDSLPVGLRVEVEGVVNQGSSTLRLTKLKVAD